MVRSAMTNWPDGAGASAGILHSILALLRYF